MESIHFYSDRLMTKLNKILVSRVTVVEAPAGYGKTTAVLNSLARKDSHAVHVFTAVNGDLTVSYKRLIEVISAIDKIAGKSLETTGLPNRKNLKNVTDIIRGIDSETETWLVIDNMQFLQFYMDPKFFSAFTQLVSKNVHIILITQYLSELQIDFCNDPNINMITISDLSLNKTDIINFYKLYNISLTDSEAGFIHKETEGWAVAVSLLLSSAMETGKTMTSMDLDSLILEVIWSKLNKSDRLSLMPLGLFDSLSPVQLSKFNDSQKFKALIRRIPMIRYDETQGRYFVHVILSDFLKKRLDNEFTTEREEIYKKCGDLYRSYDRQHEAIGCYYSIKDYESILRTDLLLLEFSKINGIPFYEIAEDIVKKCSEDVLKKYPASLLKLAYYLFNAAREDLYDMAMKKARDIIFESKDEHLIGEWYLMAAFYKFPYLELMEEYYIEAAKHLKKPSIIFKKEMPFMFGNPSQWFFFYNEPGKGDETGETFTRVLKLYMTLTNGHGAGCDSVFKGELASMRCNYSVARQHAYEAMYAAEESQDVTGSFGTALLLGRIAVTTSDMSALSDAIEYLETKASAFPFMIGSETNQVLLEIVRSMLLSMLDRAAEAPEWTIHRRSQHSRMALATIQLNYATSVSLMVAGEFENALGHLKAMTKQKYLLFNTVTQYFVYIGLSLCHLALMQPIQAKDALLKSICIAEEDRMITTFLHFRKHLTPILLMPEILLSHGPFVQAILKQKLTFARSDSDILPNLKQEDLPESLTSREEEIALLAARGLHNKEIADKLQISQWTVKNHLQSIYTKLDIDRRSQLTELLR